MFRTKPIPNQRCQPKESPFQAPFPLPCSLSEPILQYTWLLLVPEKTPRWLWSLPVPVPAPVLSQGTIFPRKLWEATGFLGW